MAATVGYSGTPLPEDVQFQSRRSATTDVTHLFCDRKADLAQQLEAARPVLKLVIRKELR